MGCAVRGGSRLGRLRLLVSCLNQNGHSNNNTVPAPCVEFFESSYRNARHTDTEPMDREADGPDTALNDQGNDLHVSQFKS